MADTTAPAAHTAPFVLHGERAVYFHGYVDGDAASLYDQTALRAYTALVAEITRPMPGQTVTLTPAQRDIAQIRFNDEADEQTDGGAEVIGSTLRVTDVAEALATIDNAIDICDDNIQSGYLAAKYAAERRTLRNLRAKVLAAALADPRNAQD